MNVPINNARSGMCSFRLACCSFLIPHSELLTPHSSLPPSLLVHCLRSLLLCRLHCSEAKVRVGKCASEEPTYYRSAHKAAYPGTSKSSKSRLIETHTNSLKHLLAKDGVIYKEAMDIVVEDIKKIIQEEMADTVIQPS